MMSRPRVLIDAGRAGAGHYQRDRDLPRAIGRTTDPRLPGHGAAMMMLFDVEAELEAARQERVATYRPTRHVAALSALLAEARLLRMGRE